MWDPCGKYYNLFIVSELGIHTTMSSTIGSQTSTYSPAMKSTSSSFTPASFGHFITVKHNRENHLLWRAQIVPYLRSQNLLGYVDGTKKAPAMFVVLAEEEGSGARQIQNPEYQVWFQRERLVLSALVLSLTKEILGYVLFLTSVMVVWEAIQAMFASQIKGRIM